MPVSSASAQLASRAGACRLLLLNTPRTAPGRQQLRTIALHTRSSSTNSRPSIPFLSVPSSKLAAVRHYTSQRSKWLRHEAKLAVRYILISWGIGAACLVIAFFVNEEMVEREFPTPHEWDMRTRKLLRDANWYRQPKDGHVVWPEVFQLSRNVIARLEDPKVGGEKIVKLPGPTGIPTELPGEFLPCDITAYSEEWRRGYFEALIQTAKAAEYVEGWVRDVTRKLASPPEFVIGPSNPRPKPIPPGNPPAPREENCEQAWPKPDNYYLKILATKGFNARQKMEAALQYASYNEYKQLPDGAQALYQLALAEATSEFDESRLPYDPKTHVLRDSAGLPSSNVLDALTALASFKARQGDVAAALPIYLSLLKARRSLPNDPPRIQLPKRRPLSVYRQVVDFFAPPEYPPPPPDGTQSPWRDPEERCQEAALDVYIGEILYTTASREEGLAWTRDGVDAAEEQLRKLGTSKAEKPTKETCRQCLITGLDNWSTMVARLAKEEARKREEGPKTKVFGLWNAPQEAADRWAAEKLVIEERIRRTQELTEDVEPPPIGLSSYFKA
ncbi:hypothetical protein S40288_04763 [Stachybotrys chartarum IBT 40288]|nr:hypothetical protein S40288_04763 [Stachybotrys chartarum IBT 40288]